MAATLTIMSVDGVALAAGVEELRALLRADGADLQIVGTDGEADRVHLRLDLANVECLECVIPPDMLDQMIRDGLRRRVAPDLDVIFDDPRRAANNA
jgi:Fe-S cluster biogenesis protein NfuA